MPEQIWVDKIWWKKIKFVALAILIIGGLLRPMVGLIAKAEGCPDLKIIFARGSGSDRGASADYVEFKNRIGEKISDTGLAYEFIDLDYPAVGVGIDNLKVTAGALIGSGDAYEFGASVDDGVQKLVEIVNNGCSSTKYVIGGYSQGAMVISKSLPKLDAEKIIYAATFGDPKLYLPEGEGLMPAACRGDNLSDYRMYVPDCKAYKGLLGAYIPYEPASYEGKLGTWCNRRDIFCSSYLNVNEHLGYVSGNLYGDASRVIASKITRAFRIENAYISPHDTAILINSTESMARLIEHFKDDIINLADETFEADGRVALHDYRDIDGSYKMETYCDFETCTKENFDGYLKIIAAKSGDDSRSMLSASIKTMNELGWQRGATKSLVIFTDAPFLSPDMDGTTIDDVVLLSKTIDPVNIYIVTSESVVKAQPEIINLTESTGGFVVTGMESLGLLKDRIMDRYDTLPKVEEITEDTALPNLEIVGVFDEGENITIKFAGENSGVIVILNEAILGIASGDTIKIEGLKRDVMNYLNLVPIDDEHKGTPIEIELPIVSEMAEEVNASTTKKQVEASSETNLDETEDVEETIKIETNEAGFGSEIRTEDINMIVPKTPDTGLIK